MPNDGGTGGGVETPFYLPNFKMDKKMTKKEAKCYWMNYPNAAQEFIDQGIALTVKSAEFSYNYMANEEHRIRSVECQKAQTQLGHTSGMKYTYFGLDPNFDIQYLI